MPMTNDAPSLPAGGITVPITEFKSLLNAWLDARLGNLRPHRESPLLALAPANDIAIRAAGKLRERGYRVAVADRAPGTLAEDRIGEIRHHDLAPVRTYDELASLDVSRVIVLSPLHGEVISNRISEVTDAPIDVVDFSTSLPIGGIVQLLAQRRPPRALKRFVEARRLILVHDVNPSEMHEKISSITSALDAEIVWIDIDNDVAPHIDRHGQGHANLIDGLLLARHRRAQTLFIPVPGNGRYVLAPLMRESAPNTRIVAYLYDWIELYCPWRYHDLYRRQRKIDERATASEYAAYRGIIDGTYADGILYKDLGPQLPTLRGFPGSSLYFPYFFGKSAYVEPTQPHPPSHNRIVFLGVLHRKHSSLFELDDLNDVFNVFRSLLEQGFHLTVYDKQYSGTKVDEYRNEIGDHENFDVQPGANLTELLPRIQGLYQWGYLLYDSPCTITAEHYRVTLPSKVAAYLALGVPILISTQLRHAADLITRFGLGVAVDPSNIPELSETLRTVDYPSMVENILDFRDRFSLDENSHTLSDFISRFFRP